MWCGYENAETYQQQMASFGAVVGRNCNRIANAEIVIDGVTYQLEKNDNENNLHSGSQATSRRLWDAEEQTADKITFVIKDAEGQQGYPGNAVMKVTYEVTEANELSITYHATADKTTIFNMTNHAYFNLNGAGSGSAMEQILQIRASHYTPVIDAKSIPTGEIASVDGTPFDFREAKPMGRDIEQANDQLSYGHGYDHNFVLDKERAGLEKDCHRIQYKEWHKDGRDYGLYRYAALHCEFHSGTESAGRSSMQRAGCFLSGNTVFSKFHQ